MTGSCPPPHPIRRYRWAISLPVVLALTAAACTSDENSEIPVSGEALDRGGETAVVDGAGEGAPSAVTVTARDIAFDVDRIEVSAGTGLSIVFTNADAGIPHNLHVNDDRIGGQTDIKPGPDTQTLEILIDEPGTYSFICDVHPAQMTGEIVAS